jgi:hypothetical protein
MHQTAAAFQPRPLRALLMDGGGGRASVGGRALRDVYELYLPRLRRVFCVYLAHDPLAAATGAFCADSCLSWPLFSQMLLDLGVLAAAETESESDMGDSNGGTGDEFAAASDGRLTARHAALAFGESLGMRFDARKQCSALAWPEYLEVWARLAWAQQQQRMSKATTAVVDVDRGDAAARALSRMLGSIAWPTTNDARQRLRDAQAVPPPPPPPSDKRRGSSKSPAVAVELPPVVPQTRTSHSTRLVFYDEGYSSLTFHSLLKTHSSDSTVFSCDDFLRARFATNCNSTRELILCSHVCTHHSVFKFYVYYTSLFKIVRHRGMSVKTCVIKDLLGGRVDRRQANQDDVDHARVVVFDLFDRTLARQILVGAAAADKCASPGQQRVEAQGADTRRGPHAFRCHRRAAGQHARGNHRAAEDFRGLANAECRHGAVGLARKRIVGAQHIVARLIALREEEEGARARRDRRVCKHSELKRIGDERALKQGHAEQLGGRVGGNDAIGAEARVGGADKARGVEGGSL